MLEDSIPTLHYDKSVKKYVANSTDGKLIYGYEYEFYHAEYLKKVIVMAGSGYGRQDLPTIKSDVVEVATVLSKDSTGQIGFEKSTKMEYFLDGLRYLLEVFVYDSARAIGYKMSVSEKREM